MIEFADALKSSRAYNLIKHDIDTGNLSHAYMVISPDTLALNNLFEIVACAVYCKDDACLACTTCHRILHGNHADVKFINSDNKNLKVEDVESLIDDTGTRPFESDHKLYFVFSADKMNAAAQNKLLKTLEEPQKTVTIFLGVSRESAMLDTVKSRTKKITLDRFSQEDISSALKEEGFPSDSAETAAACADGMLGRAKEIAEDKSFAENYAQTVNVFKNLKKSGDVASFLNEKVLDKERLPVFLDIASLIVRDMMAAKTDERLITNRRTAEEVKAMSREYSLLALSNILYLINEERKKLNVYVSSVGVAENLLLGILEVKYKCR
ncbi:MAG: ATP-binding protein [Christensenellales bacterium]